MTPLSEAQRRTLFELVICEPTRLSGTIKKADRDRLVERGLVRLDPNPRGRGKVVSATEAGWVHVVDNLDAPFTRAQPRLLWNHLTRRLAAYLADRDETLTAVLEAGAGELAEAATPDASGAEAPAALLRRVYLELSGGRLGHRLRVAELRGAAPLDPAIFDASLRGLARAGEVVLFPEDERGRLSAEDHAAAVDVSGEAKHLVYWER